MEEKQFDELNYLLTSDFDNLNDASPEQFKELLLKFRYEYRLLSGRNTSLTSEITKLNGEIENLSNVNIERDRKNKIAIADLQNELDFLKPKLNRKLTFKERVKGKINE